ncbi:MAG: hypothetical protein ACREMY_33090 [bacterium]
MATTVISVLVSAFVSLVGIFVSMNIAARAKRAEIEKLKLDAALRAKNVTASSLKQYAATIERARIAYWRLLSELRESNRWRRSYTASDLSSLVELTRGVFVQFENAWADTKSEVPAELLHYIRAVRHDARHMAAAIWNLLQYVVESPETALDPAQDVDTRQDIDRAICELLDKLEELFRAVSTATRIATGELVTYLDSPAESIS